MYQDCFQFYLYSLIKRETKNVHHFTKLILGKKVDSMAKRKTIKIFLIVTPFLHAVIK